MTSQSRFTAKGQFIQVVSSDVRDTVPLEYAEKECLEVFEKHLIWSSYYKLVYEISLGLFVVIDIKKNSEMQYSLMDISCAKDAKTLLREIGGFVA